MTARRVAFTMIELLITIAIIGVLMGMLIVAIPNVIYNAKALKTASRMDAVLHGLSRIGQQEGSAAMILQRDAYLGGVFQFDTTGASGSLDPSPAASTVAGVSPRTDNLFLTDAQLALPHYFGFPWGKKDLINQSGTSDPQNATTPATSVTLDQLNVNQYFGQYGGTPQNTLLCSIALLKMAGILPPDDPTTPVDEAQQAYLTDRNVERAWNDAWGNPLVLAWGLYQPGGANAVAGKRMSEALKQYQYNRSVYIAIGSVGPTPFDTTANAAIAASDLKSNSIDAWRDTLLPALWKQINAVCQPTPETTWGPDGFDRPPWQGVKKGKIKQGGYELKCQLSAPHEFK